MQPEVKWIMDYLDRNEMIEDMDKALHLAFHWIHDDHGYESKNTRIREYRTATEDTSFALYDIMSHIFAGTLLHPEGMTYQAMIGYISGNIKCADPLDRAKCGAELIALAYQAGLVVITKVSEKTFMITTEWSLDEEMPEFAKHQPLFKKPQPVAFNPILGNRFKQHDQDVCLDHINRMNAIPLCLETRVIDEMVEMPSHAFETEEQEDQWADFIRRSQAMYFDVITRNNNKFHLEHSMDTRGRCYCSGYYINYQGASYKKAIVQLADKEIVKL